MVIFIGVFWLAVVISDSEELEYTNKLLSQLPAPTNGVIYTDKREPTDEELLGIIPQAHKDALEKGSKFGQLKSFSIIGVSSLMIGAILFFVPFFVQRGVVISQMILLMPLVLFLSIENTTIGNINKYTSAGIFLGLLGLVIERVKELR
jgi:uncharacterized protein YqhQ